MQLIKGRPLPTKNICRSFRPFIGPGSRVLILGSMPGPEALRKQQYYGFNGNHFWSIIPALFGEAKPSTYNRKIALLKRHGIALWDVFKSCVREGALDSAIREAALNPIPQLIDRYPNIRAVFLNGRTAHATFLKTFAGAVRRPVHYLPSTSPAHASLSLHEKIEKWSLIKRYLAMERK